MSKGFEVTVCRDFDHLWREMRSVLVEMAKENGSFATELNPLTEEALCALYDAFHKVLVEQPFVLDQGGINTMFIPVPDTLTGLLGETIEFAESKMFRGTWYAFGGYGSPTRRFVRKMHKHHMYWRPRRV